MEDVNIHTHANVIVSDLDQSFCRCLFYIAGVTSIIQRKSWCNHLSSLVQTYILHDIHEPGREIELARLYVLNRRQPAPLYPPQSLVLGWE